MEEVYHKKENGRRAAGRFSSFASLRREASEGATHVAFAEALQRAIAQLANPLARDTEHRADFFQGVLSATFETEIETKHLRITRGQRAQRLLDFVGEKAVHRF